MSASLTLQVARAVHEARRRAAPDVRPMILTRSAFLGQQRYAAATWSGDIGNGWDTLARQIPAGLNMAAAGHAYWTVDAGGFFRPGKGQYTDPAYQERFLRWFQYATFLPCFASTAIRRTPKSGAMARQWRRSRASILNSDTACFPISTAWRARRCAPACR